MILCPAQLSVKCEYSINSFSEIQGLGFCHLCIFLMKKRFEVYSMKIGGKSDGEIKWWH